MSTRYIYTMSATIEVNIAADTIEDGRERALEILREVCEENGKFIIHACEYNQDLTDKENE